MKYLPTWYCKVVLGYLMGPGGCALQKSEGFGKVWGFAGKQFLPEVSKDPNNRV